MIWRVVALITTTLSSGVCPVSTSANCSVFKTHLLGLSQTVANAHGYLLFSNYSIGSQLNFAISSEQPLWLRSFFTVVIPVSLFLFCLLIVEAIVQLLKALGGTSMLSICTLIKNTLATALLLMLQCLESFA